MSESKAVRELRTLATRIDSEVERAKDIYAEAEHMGKWRVADIIRKCAAVCNEVSSAEAARQRILSALDPQKEGE